MADILNSIKLAINNARHLAFATATLLFVIGCAQADGAPAVQRPLYQLGHTPSATEVAALDIDVNPTGAGLPPGEGTAATGATTYLTKCAACHGPKGEGIAPNPRLIGNDPPAGFAFASDAKAVKTIGNYWSYSTTLYDYLRRAMPLTAPGSLTPEETYGLVAFLLSENGIVASSFVADAKSLPDVVMPARRYFVRDNRIGGRTFR